MRHGVGRYVRKNIGVLALQGSFVEHKDALYRVGASVSEVRLPQHLDGLDGLIIPGGESTTISLLMDRCKLREPIAQRIQGGMSCWGTCAGMILLARSLTENYPTPLGVMDIGVARNAFGRQVDSFVGELAVPVLGEELFHGVFIRAPVFSEIGSNVHVLASLQDGRVVAAREDHMLATAFHPELAMDTRFHEYFLQMSD